MKKFYRILLDWVIPLVLYIWAYNIMDGYGVPLWTQLGVGFLFLSAGWAQRITEIHDALNKV